MGRSASVFAPLVWALLTGPWLGCGGSAGSCPSGTSGFQLVGSDATVEEWCKNAAGVADGPYTKRDSPGGPLLRQGAFADGDADGAWTEWTKVDDGTSTRFVKTLEASYDRGLPDGTFRAYFSPSGALKSESTYKGGVACGTWKELDESGAVVAQPMYTPCDKLMNVDDGPPTLPSDPLLGAPPTSDFGWDGKACSGGSTLQSAPADARERFCLKDGLRDGDFGRFIAARTGERKVDEGHYAAGLRTGAWRSWHANTVLAATGSFVDDLRSGEWKRYYADGWLAEQTPYDKGLRHGVVRSYHAGGVLGGEDTFNHGALDGVSKHYTADGEPEWVGTYANNSREGKWTYYGHDLGPLTRREGMVVFGANQGAWVGTYDQSGHKEAEMTYVYNQLYGPFTQWYDNGQEAASGAYLLGERNGVWLFHHDNGQLSIQVTYLMGQPTGAYEAYYPDGKPKAKGTFGGSWTSWDLSGSPTTCNAPLGLVCP